MTVQITGVDALSSPARGVLASAPLGLIIDGEFAQAADGRRFASIDPATGRAICEVAYAGNDDVDRAVRAARGALDGPLQKVSPAQRSALIGSLADLVEQHLDELSELESLDNGKPLADARGDVAISVGTLRYFAGWPTKIEGGTIPVSMPDVLCYTERVPVGVCASIVPWTFPLLMATWKVAPALASGCTVVLKPAEETPLTALRLGELALEAGFPAGTINVLTGDAATGAALVDHPGVDKVSFCGSTAVGREVAAKCGQSLKRVTMELGGKSPNIILPDADLDLAIPGSFLGMYSNSGQFCDAGSRLFVHADIFDVVIERLVAFCGDVKVGPGLDPASQLGPLISAESRDRVNGYIESGIEAGAELVVGGVAPASDGDGYFVSPTLFTNVSDNMRIAREEIFGPVLVAMPFHDLDEVVERANDTEYGLAAGLWTQDLSQAHSLARRLEAGYVYVNSWWGADDPGAPFGGFKASGLGREKGHENLDAYLETKTVWVQL